MKRASPMSFRDVMKELESLGTAQNRKVYARHGFGPNMFGVSFANLNKMAKRLKIQHDLALELWATGNHDARVLACMIADPVKATGKQLDAWANEVDNYCGTDLLAQYVSKTAFADSKAKLWVRSKADYVGQAGWDLVARLAMGSSEIPDGVFEGYIETIERTIQTAENRTRHAMNNALIAIGIRNVSLQAKAITAARRIGKVEVDHGETSCKTPDAEAYILKTIAYRKSKANPKKAATK
jgi:3-methyladenine DNA glycosylase AlkD